MLEFLKQYWPLCVCGVLIVIAVVLLIVFRDKEEKPENATASEPAQQTEEKPAEWPKEEKVEEKVEEPKEQVAEEKVEEETAQDAEQEPAPEKEVQPAKKKGGRKPKAEKPAEVIEEPKAEEQPAKKKGGRKPKAEKPAEVNEQPNEEVKDEPVEENMEEEKKAPTQKYMVTYDKDSKDWVVKKTGAQKASKRCKTKKEAMEVAERLAENQDLNLTVKKKNGKFQKRENASR